MWANSTDFLINDTLPWEIPLLFSNFSLAQFVESNPSRWADCIEPRIQLTIPYNFLIVKSQNSDRVLSLVNPVAQLGMLKFIQLYDKEVLEYCQLHSCFSIRYPSKISNVSDKKKDVLFSQTSFLLGREYQTSTIRSLHFGYFKRTSPSTLPAFYQSQDFLVLETRYKFMMKLDIQHCFYHIYTHSIDWAYLGDRELAKEWRTNKNRLSAQLDALMTSMNYDETNGIVVGPEFSRIVAEVVLMRVDELVLASLARQGFHFGQDYEVRRYVDDIFVFYNDVNFSEKVNREYELHLRTFRLEFNAQKTSVSERPFVQGRQWIIHMNELLKDYFTTLLSFLQSSTLPTGLWERRINKDKSRILQQIRILISEHLSEREHLVSYFFRAFERQSRDIYVSLENLSSDKVNSALTSFIDILHYFLSGSMTYKNTVLFISFATKIYNIAVKLDLDKTINVLFKKGLELLQYNSSGNLELLNLIIFMKQIKKDLPESILIDVLNRDRRYFALATVMFYLSGYDRQYRFRATRNHLNDILSTIIKKVEEKYVEADKGKKQKNVREFLCSDLFYPVHDFYDNCILDSSNKKRLNEIKKWVQSANLSSGSKQIVDFFWDYVKDFDRPFMQFGLSNEDFTARLVEKTMREETQYE